MSNKANGKKKYYVGGAIAMGMGAINAGVGYAQQRKAQRALAQAEEDTAGTIRSKAEQLRTARQQFDVSTALDQNKLAAEAAASQLAEEGGLRGLMSGQSRIQRAQQMADMSAIGSLGQNAARMNEMAEMQQQALVSQRNAGNLDRLARAADMGAQAKMQGLGQIGLGAAQFLGGGGAKREQRGPDVAGFDTEKLQTKSMSPLQAESNAAVGLGPKRMAPIPSISSEGIGAKTYLEPKGPTSLANITIPSVNLTGSSLPPLIDTPGPNTQTTEYSVYTGVVPTSVDAALKALGKDPMYNFSDGGMVEEEKDLDALQEEMFGRHEHGGVMPTSDPEEVSGLKAMLKMIGGLFGKDKPKEVEEVEETEEVMETPGEFNHNTNPIDLVQDGEKIGEATGGEYIFNPEQSEMLKQLAAQGDSELHRYLRELLSREEFNEEEDYD
jgi:hypothetical protein